MVHIERVSRLSRDDADQLGVLAVELTQNFKNRNIDEGLLMQIMKSPSHDLFVARNQIAQPVGMATMSLVLGPVAGRVAYLEDFVVSREARGQRVGSKLWREVEKWSVEQGAEKIEFTSNPKRQAAHAFYLAQGAKVRESTVFRYDIQE
jgi:GNAT superfamily N-acetyltransferase